MGAREDFEQAVRRGDFVGAAAVWTKEDLDASPSLDAFQTKLRASLEDREVTIGRTLVAADGEYEYLGDVGQNGARLAFVPNAGSLDQIEYIADVDALQAHLGRSSAQSTDKDAVAAFFALSERASERGRRAVNSQDLPANEQQQAPAPPVTDAPSLPPVDALRRLLAGHGDSVETIEATVAHASKDFVNDRVYVGVLRDFGPAPYLHDKDNTQSYFVTFKAPDGVEDTVWGKDLASAVQAEGLQPGAEFVLAFQGAKPVTVKVKARDAEGKLTGEVTEAPAVRNEWLATSVARLRAEAAELGPGQLEQAAPVDTIERAESRSLDATVSSLSSRMAQADWFYFASDDPAQRAAGAQEIDSLKADLKALSGAHPAVASQIWLAQAPKEYLLTTDDFLSKAATEQLLSPEAQSIRDRMSKVEMAWMYSESKETRDNGRGVVDPLWNEMEELGKTRPSEAFQIWKEFAQATYPNYVPAFLKAPVPGAEQVDAITGVAKSVAVVDAERQSEDAIQGVRRAKPALVSDRHASEDAIVRVAKDGEKGKDADTTAAGKKPLTTLLNGRFILRDNGEYFRIEDGVESKRVALVDEETKIRFVDKQMDTFQAAIELAKHKDWEAILVTGSDKFRAEAWHHARMAGLEVIGYEPTEKDLASLKAAQENEVKPKAGPQLGSPPAATSVDVAHTKSLAEINKLVLDAGYGARPAALDNSKNDGKIIFESDKHFAQDTGRKVATIHDKANFDKSVLRAAIETGGSMKVQYENGRATIESKKDRSQARGR